MLRSLYAGISGMKANQTKLDIIANNIANCGTTAFKSSRVRFQDMVSQSMSDASSSSTNTGGVNGKQVGLGVQISGIDTMVGQGMMQPTSRNLDVAMDGEGYLIVATGAIGGSVSLGDDHKIDATKSSGFDISYTRDGALTLDDAGHLLTSDGLRVMGYSVGGSLTNASDGTTATIFVDANGKTAPTAAGGLIALSIPDTIGTGTDAKKVKSFSIEKDGTIKATLEGDGVTVIGQIAMASFNNPAGLGKVGKNLYTSTSNSGQAVVRSGLGATTNDNSKAYGSMLSGMLEMSNVDLAEQFTDMIVASRAFQAMGKTITTGDEILQDIIGLKR
ncbi:flagellar hook-basal body complex protein [Clostridium estertheticum]|uniref:Flagellar hook protein FlgE n=1 Tax=Clostridium estertheticum subsp. estertheticum TaxID=1552 RepID=A0A1J0GIN8_9CLOT|nr:flagellar hook-basal body complex protein [Clostridium estertheticum]APC41143.1 flagellar biosynthesis protein FlgE [Clostridium estertheticum subsp. estertheticum]MBU3074150.1 flagellar hook-basal body complex protein [Clostridium estertheticum]MBU3164244.1 flagellar hook-basal body complex protein [Clostridium estertheticum]